MDGLRLTASCRHAISVIYLVFLLAVLPIFAGIAFGPWFHGQSLGLFNLLIGGPMLLLILPFWCIALCYVAGRVEVRVTRDEVRLFTGVGVLGFHRWLHRSELTSLATPVHLRRGSSAYISPGIRLTVAGRKEPVWFGRLLTLKRRDWLAEQMREHLGLPIEPTP